MARLFSQVFLVVFIIVAFTGNWLFIKIFGASFNKMQLPMLILIPGIFSLSISSLLSAHFSGKGNPKVNLQGAVLAVIIMVTGDYFFVLRYGIIAAAIISTLSYFIECGYISYRFYKDSAIGWLEFIRWRKSDYNFIAAIFKKNVD